MIGTTTYPYADTPKTNALREAAEGAGWRCRCRRSRSASRGGPGGSRSAGEIADAGVRQHPWPAALDLRSAASATSAATTAPRTASTTPTCRPRRMPAPTSAPATRSRASGRSGIGHNVPLTAVDALPCVVAARPASLRGWCSLTVDHGGCWLGRTPQLFSRPPDKYMDDPLPPTCISPRVKVTLHRRIGRELMRQRSPLAARRQDIENRLHNTAQIGPRGWLRRFVRGNRRSISPHSASVISLA